VTRNQAPGMSIDFGEITTGLSAVYGVSKGFTDNKMLRETVEKVAVKSMVLFGASADAVAETQIPHFYEYRGESEGQEVQNTISGRLWRWHLRKDPSGAAIEMDTRQSRVPGGPSQTLLDEFPNMSGHYFADKAAHLENEPTLSARAGVQQHTERTKEGTPRVLIFEERGRVFFRKRRVWRNEFYGKFEEHFRYYFGERFLATADQRAQSALRTIRPAIVKSVSQPIAAVRIASIPKMPRPYMITLLDVGRPYTGIRMKQGVQRRAEKSVEQAVRKGLVRAWEA